MILPSGTVTFLFTDIEGSSRLWELHPEAMQSALAAHDALLRHCIESNGGFVFKTVGDSFCAVFVTAVEALHAALAAQLQFQRGMNHGGPGEHEEETEKEKRRRGEEEQSLAPCDSSAPATDLVCVSPSPSLAFSVSSVVPIRVRMALHTGTAQERDNDYFGLALSRVARLAAIAYGGQTLLSQATFELVRDELPNGVSLKPLGAHRLKDLQRPEQAYQLQHADLPDGFPPLASLDAFPNNLPQQLTSFIGRERQMEEIGRLLPSTRLLTLVGSGGAGKTRLSLQVGANALECYPDGAWLVELAPLADAALVTHAVLSALNVREEAGKAAQDTLVAYLKPRCALLILDNCEHLVAACAVLADTLLRYCPHLGILASSREALGIAGEVTYRVPSLSLPDANHLPTGEAGVAALTQYEAARLFIDRASALQPHFAVTNANAPFLAQICCRLDGLPLAIELAAARVKVLSLEQIAAKIEDRFRLLTSGSRTALPRQQTLRALIDWSYDLLSEPEKSLLARLSVFAGGWDLEACEQVASDDTLEAWEMLDVLAGLVDKSLVVQEEKSGTSRFRLLETIRHYAGEKLAASGQAKTFQRKHRDYFLTLAETLRPQLRGEGQFAASRHLEAEAGNLRAALEHCREDADSAEQGLRLAGSLWRWFLMRGHLAEGRACLMTALERPDAQTLTRARADALTGAGNLAWSQGDVASAQRLHEASLEISRALEDQRGTAIALGSLGVLAQQRGEREQARRLYEESLSLQRELNDQPGIAYALVSLGGLAQEENDLAQARDLHEASLIIRRDLNDEQGIAIALGNLGHVALAQGDIQAARAFFTECLLLCRRLDEKFIMLYALEGFASLAHAQHQARRAVELYSAAAAFRTEIGAPLPPARAADISTILRELEAALSCNDFAAAYSAGQTMNTLQAMELALNAEK